MEGEESINMRLVDLLDKMRLLLQQATLSGENTLGRYTNMMLHAIGMYVKEFYLTSVFFIQQHYMATNALCTCSQQTFNKLKPLKACPLKFFVIHLHAFSDTYTFY